MGRRNSLKGFERYAFERVEDGRLSAKQYESFSGFVSGHGLSSPQAGGAVPQYKAVEKAPTLALRSPWGLPDAPRLPAFW